MFIESVLNINKVQLIRLNDKAHSIRVNRYGGVVQMKKKLVVSTLILIMTVSGISLTSLGIDLHKQRSRYLAFEKDNALGEGTGRHVNMTSEELALDYISRVKNGFNKSYKYITYGEAFETFFYESTWQYFEAKTGEHVVEFSGICDGEEGKIRTKMQFIVHLKEGTFEVVAMTFNEVPQNPLMISGLLEKVFEL